MFKALLRQNTLFKQLLWSNLLIVFISIIGIGGFALYAYRTNSFDNLRHYLTIEAASINNILENFANDKPQQEVLSNISKKNLAFWIVVYDTDQNLIYSSVGNHKRIDLPAEFYDKAKYIANTNHLETFKHYMPLSEVQWYFVIRPYIDKYSNEVKGIIQLGVPLENFEQGFLDSFSVLIALQVILAVFTIFLIYFLALRIAEPVKQLNSQVKNITKTGILQPADIHTNIQDEIHELADSFNIMINKLKDEKEFQKEFIANASHELKTPVMAIASASEILQFQYKNNKIEELEEFIDIVYRQSLRFQELIDSLLDISVLEIGKIELSKNEFQIFDFTKECAEDIQTLIHKHNIDFSWFVENKSSIEYINADKIKLKRAIHNLLVNAIKHVQNYTGEILLSTIITDTTVKFTVTDNGTGISEDNQSKIFERFYRVDKDRSRRTGGTGLGLSITKNIIELHQGTITVSSKLNEGSTFSIILPLELPS